MPRNRSRMPQVERSEKVISWRPSEREMTMFEAVAAIRGWTVNRLCEEATVQFCYEVAGDALRLLGKIRRANRRERAQKAGLARAAKARGK